MEEVIDTPLLMFPEFTHEVYNRYLKKYRFEDIFVFTTGKNIKQNEASPEFATPCVRYGELYHLYNEVINEVVNRTNLDKSELHFSEGNEILLPSAGEDPLDIGSASALTVRNVAIGRTINILKPKSEFLYSPIYVSYYINEKLKRKISSLAKGVSISNVYNSDLKKLEITLPSLPEQTKIANFLTTVDERIKLLTQQKEKLEQYKKGVMQQLFSRQIRFKDDNGKAFPEWEEKKLGEIFKFSKGSSLSKSEIIEHGQNHCIHYGELFTIYGEVIAEIYSKTNSVGNRSIVGDILMPSSDVTPTGLATASVIQQNDVIIGGDVNVLRPKVDIDSVYMSYCLNFFKKKLIKLVTGTTIKHIYNKDVSMLTYKIPAVVDEQQKIASFLSSIDRKIDLVSSQIEQTKSWKKGLLQKMFV